MTELFRNRELSYDQGMTGDSFMATHLPHRHGMPRGFSAGEVVMPRVAGYLAPEDTDTAESFFGAGLIAISPALPRNGYPPPHRHGMPRGFSAGEVYLAPVDTNTAGLFFGRGVLQYAPLSRIVATHHPPRHGMPTVSVVVSRLSPSACHRVQDAHDCISDELHRIHTIILHQVDAPTNPPSWHADWLRCRIAIVRRRHAIVYKMLTRCISHELHPIYTVILHCALDSIDPDAVRQYHDGIILHYMELVLDLGMTVDAVRASTPFYR